MKSKMKVSSSLIRLALTLLMLGRIAYVPKELFAGAKVNLRVTSGYGQPNAVTGMNAEPDFNYNDGGRIKLEWIAPSDGGNQDVFSYIVKYATFSVTSLSNDTTAWWNHPNCLTVLDSDLPVHWGRKALVSKGITENLSITGLDYGTYYYFGVKAIDRYFKKADFDLPLKGLTSQTSGYATTPPWVPQYITDLTALATGERYEVSLEWTVPNFMDTLGMPQIGHIWQPGEYCIQYSTAYKLTNGNDITLPSQINKPNLINNWDSSSRIFVSTKNISTGDNQRFLITGLTHNTTYYVHVFTRNEWPNKWSYVSVPVAKVVPYLSIDPVFNLSSAQGGSADENPASYIDLTWTCPDEDNIVGARICYSRTTYPDTPTWSDSILVSGLLPLQTTTYRHVQLIPRSNYFYTVYSLDKFGEYSLVGVNTSAYTSTDYIAPDAPIGITSLITLNMPEGGEDEYTITLNWTNPSEIPLYRNSDLVGTKIYYSTSTQVQALQSELALAAGANSEAKTFIHSNLEPYTTYYYSLASYDAVPNTSTWQSWMSYISERYVPPEKPVIAASLVNAVKNPDKGCYAEISWRTEDAVTPPLEGVNITYRTDRYPTAPGDGTQIVRTPLVAGTTYTTPINKLRPNTTYYMILTAYSSYGVYSRQTKLSFVTIVPWTDNAAPFYPLNLSVELIGESGVKLTWDKVKYSQDMTKFANTYFPEMDELYGYEIYRTVIVNDDSSWELAGNVIGQTAEFSDTVPDKKLYYYKVRAYDASYNYSDSYMINTEGSIIIMGEDGSYLTIPAELAGVVLNKKSNIYGKDIIITLARKDTEEVGPIPKSIEWEAFAIDESNAKINLDRFNKFNFPKSVSKTEPGVEFSMSYAVSDANSAAKKSIPSAKLKGIPLEEVEKWLSIFYFNGVEWLKLGSTPDKDLEVLKTQIKLAGKYQLRKSAPATEFTFYSVMPKIITPNGDEQNDRAMFRYANPKLSSIEIKIFDINGALVRKLGDFEKSSDVHGDYIYWDGADEDGVTVLPGVYLYQLDGEGKVINGTVVVAR